jgi:hypothetical protein
MSSLTFLWYTQSVVVVVVVVVDDAVVGGALSLCGLGGANNSSL